MKWESHAQGPGPGCTAGRQPDPGVRQWLYSGSGEQAGDPVSGRPEGFRQAGPECPGHRCGLHG